jgi:hypothetical protein
MLGAAICVAAVATVVRHKDYGHVAPGVVLTALSALDLALLVAMPRFAANLSMMFNEVPFLDRFAAAGKAGFEGWNSCSPTTSGRRTARAADRRTG